MSEEAIKLNIHGVCPISQVNGPGKRLVVFFQGCRRLCPGCFNPDTHPFETRELYTPEGLLERYASGVLDGITISGGEPFMQPGGLASLVKGARFGKGLSVVVYTGFTYEEICAEKDMSEALEHIDVLVDGGFDSSRKERSLLARGSTNQRFHFLSGRYGIGDFYMQAKAEITIRKDGTAVGTGFGPAQASDFRRVRL